MTKCIVVLTFAALASPAWAQDDARVIAGFEQSAAASASPAQKMFADLYFAQALSSRTHVWGDLRLSSMPRQINSTAVTLTTDVIKAVATTPLNRIARSGEFLVGVETRVSGSPTATALSLIGSYGATAPLNLDSGRNRFFRQYYGGVRVVSQLKSPLTLDVEIGQNEAITGGRLEGTVLRFDSFYALPTPGAGFVYLYGTMLMKTSAGGAGSDLYRLGVGIDFVQLLKALRNN
ncbi:MAG TPA: hypothetical protein VK687_10755 [Bryobacteraceae bacterium]|jgi:hypothetical protein|nr:hypothetical protein [Bryobacteraceae bacterium]